MLNLLSKVVPLTDPVGPVNKGIVYRPSDGGVMERQTMEVSVSVGWLPVDLLGERDILLPGHLHVKERDGFR